MSTTESGTVSLPITVGANIRLFRMRRGISGADLARFAGLEEADVADIEDGRTFPAIDVVWRLSSALDMPFGAILSGGLGNRAAVSRRAEAEVLASTSGGFTSRPLFPLEGDHKAEFYELRLAPGAIERSPAHAAGTTENLVVVRGEAVIETDEGSHALNEGDALYFFADVPHAYQNASAGELVMHMVITYGDS